MRISDWSSDVCSSDLGAISDWSGRRKPLTVLGYGLGAIAKPLFPIASSAGLVLAARFVDRIGKGIRGAPRSEERRVGKGWVGTGRVRWSPCQSNKKKTRTYNTQCYSKNQITKK